MSETFYIKKTAFDDTGTAAIDNAQRDENSFIIGPGELNGPGGVNRDSDLDLYGFGALKWGEGVDQNQYRQLENFACPQKETGDYWAAGSPPEGAYVSGTHPIAPKDENDLGIGNGITEPLNGQSWYNATDKTLYTFGAGSPGTEWRSDMAATNVLDMNGYGIINATNPTDAPTTLPGSILAPQDVVTVGWADTRFVNVTGDTMTGILNMGGNKLENIADPDSADDAVNVSYADNRYVNVTGDTMTGILNLGGNRIENIGAALAGTDAMNVDTSDGRYVGKELDSDVNTLGGTLLRVHNDAGAVGTMSEANTLQIYQPDSNKDAFQSFYIKSDYALHFGLDGATNDLFVGGWSKGAVKHKIWHAGNDGPGSGLNADYLDSYNSSSFLKTTDGYQKSDINYPTYIFSRTYSGANQWDNNTLTYSGRPWWANYVNLRFEFTTYDGNVQDLRWGIGKLNGYHVIGLGADDTDQGKVSAPFAVSEVWCPVGHRSLSVNVYHGGGGANLRLTVRRIGWHQ